MTSRTKVVLDEIGDQHSSAVDEAIADIDRMEKKIASLEAIEASMAEAAANAKFQLVTALPSTGKNNIYYIMLNSVTNLYEEYLWNGTAYDKVGTMSDNPIVATKPYYTAVDKTGTGYEEKNPKTEGWYEDVSGTMTATDDTSTTVTTYTEVDPTQAGYAEMNPTSLGWYTESDGVYTAADVTSPAENVTYYTASTTTPKTYYELNTSYVLVDPAQDGYANMSPKRLDWLEYDNGDFVATLDKTPTNAKDYFKPVSA